MRSIAILLMFSGLSVGGQTPGVHIEQQAPGNCNQNIVVISGTFHAPPLPAPCTGNSPEELKRLEQDSADLHRRFPRLQRQIDSIVKNNAVALKTKDRQINILMALVQKQPGGSRTPSPLGNDFYQAVQSGDLAKAQDILRKASADEQHRHDTAEADIFFKQAQVAELRGNPAEALEKYRQAYDLRPDNVDYGVAYGSLLTEQNRLFDAERVFDKALQTVHAQAKTNPSTLPSLATNLNSLGAVLAMRRDYYKAIARLTDALQIERTLALTDEETYKPDIAMTQLNLGIAYLYSKQLSLASDAAKESYNLYRPLAKNNPDAYLSYLCAAVNLAGTLFREEHRPADAAKAFDAALESYKALAKGNNPRYLGDVATVYMNLGQLLSDEDFFNPQGSDDAFGRSLTIYRDLVEESPENYLPALAYLRNAMGRLYMTFPVDRLAEAEAAFKEAESIRRTLSQGDGPAYLPDLATTLNDLGNYYSALSSTLRDLQNALDKYDECIRIRQSLDDSRSNTNKEAIAGTLRNKALILARMGRRKDAAETFEASISLWRELAAHDPQPFEFRLAEALNDSGDNYDDGGQLPPAEKAYLDAYRIRGRLAASDRKYRVALAETENDLGIVYKDMHKVDMAVEYYGKAQALYGELATEDPSFIPMLARVYNNRGKLNRSNGNRLAGDSDCKKASDLYKTLSEKDPRFSPMELAVCIP